MLLLFLFILWPLYVDFCFRKINRMFLVVIFFLEKKNSSYYTIIVDQDFCKEKYDEMCVCVIILYPRRRSSSSSSVMWYIWFVFIASLYWDFKHFLFCFISSFYHLVSTSGLCVCVCVCLTLDEFVVVVNDSRFFSRLPSCDHDDDYYYYPYVP